MPYSICLDTNILFMYPINEDKLKALRTEYESIKNREGVLTNWQYVFFTENELALSPLALWEYCSIKLRDFLGNNIEYHEAYIRALQITRVAQNRFGSNPLIDALTLAIGYLLAVATGVSCDDACHYVFAVQNSMDFFVTDNEKDFSSFSLCKKKEVIDKMIEILENCGPLNCVSTSAIKKEIEKLSNNQWPRIITTPSDIPY